VTPEADEEERPARRAGLLQVARTIFFGLLMIGKKETWEKGGDGARMTPGQIVAGAVIGGIVVIAVLVTIVRVVLRLASG
jgi:hypothetical protein